jgi:D-beta-D-heptose 7-phosphate kinase/D-beta-D-heptose 1-phosphate adenosyltransferase
LEQGKERIEMIKVVLITGGFDPIHSGHISYMKAARELGDTLVVGVNSDEWLTRKKGKPFLPLDERVCIVRAIRHADHVLSKFNDDDGSAKDAIHVTRMMFPDAHIIFANGGDRNGKNIPEMDYHDNNLSFAFGVGGDDKQNSSSWILNNWNGEKP